MRIYSIFVLLGLISIISGLFLIMLNETPYKKNDYNSQDIEIFNYGERIKNSSQKIEGSVRRFLGNPNEGQDTNLILGGIAIISSLKEIASIMLTSIFAIPTIISNLFELMSIPPKISTLLSGVIFSVLIIILLIKLILFAIGRE